VLASGIAQAIMLAALGVAVLYFRYWAIDQRLRPSAGWDLLICISATGFFVIGLWTLWQRLSTLLAAGT